MSLLVVDDDEDVPPKIGLGAIDDMGGNAALFAASLSPFFFSVGLANVIDVAPPPKAVGALTLVPKAVAAVPVPKLEEDVAFVALPFLFLH